MFSIATHIEYLLMSHECVVAPGLGAFLVHESGAFYDEANARFLPPTRSLGFNQDVNLNDGLLVQSVARRERISIESARQKVDAAIASFRRQLEESSALPVGNLGEISMSADGRLIFEPSVASAVNLRYRGLLPLNIKPLAVNDSHENEANGRQSRSSASLFTTALKIAASLIIALLACGMFLTTGNLIDNRRSADRASLDSGLRNNITAVLPSSESIECELPLSREITLTIAIPPAETDTPSAPVNTAEPALPGRYLLVVGSFPTLEAAKRHIGSDSSLSILEMDGRYRIYAASAKSLTEANRLADGIRESHPSVWICKR